MSCLGERLTALVDDELGHDERDRALAHLAGCARCRAEADTLRRLKRRLRGLGDAPAPDGADDLPSTDFLARLRGLPETAAEPAPEPDAPDVPVLERPQASPLHSRPRPRDNRPAARAPQRAAMRGYGVPAYGGAGALPRAARRRYLAMGAATLVIGLGAASYAAGGQQDVPAVSPAFERFSVEHALTSGDVPTTDPVDEHAVVPPAPEP